VIFYFNDLSAKSTATLKFDDLKAFTALRQPAPLTRPELIVNEAHIAVPVMVGAGEGLTIDEAGRVRLWPSDTRTPKPVGKPVPPLVLRPGGNRVVLSADTSKGAPRDVTVRVIPLGAAP
jgi:hypothetical protein